MDNLVEELPTPRTIEAGIDWVTLTWPPGSYVYENVLGQIRRMKRDLLLGNGVGFEVSNWRGLGYAGWACGPIKVARRADSAIAIISGGAAGNVAFMNNLEEARCTRLDIKFDLFYPKPKPPLTDICEEEAREYRDGRGGRPFVIDHRRPDPGAPTLYLGKRGSPLFVRVYDKEEESGGACEYAGCWRMEAEIKEEAANEIFHELRGGGFGTDDIFAVGCDLFASRGLRFAGAEYMERKCVSASRENITDSFRKLDWLTRCVNPTVRWLLRNAPERSILAALGLEQLVDFKQGGIDAID